MNISDVKTAFKIADVRIERSDILAFDYLRELKDEKGNPLKNAILTKNVGRVYILVVDSIIKKIGGSECEGGIKATLDIYRNGGLNGQPSPRSIGVWWHLFHEVSNNHKVEIYMIYQESFSGKVKGLFEEKEQEVSISYKHIENACLADYYDIEGKSPDWNLQEGHNVWSEEIETLHAITKENKGKKGTDKILDFADELRKRGIETQIKRSSKDYSKK